mgnify:CR=1 FL=1
MKMCVSARRAAMLIVGLLIIGCDVLAATVGPQIAINPTFGSAIGSQEYISLAASPTGYFAVWQSVMARVLEAGGVDGGEGLVVATEVAGAVAAAADQ